MPPDEADASQRKLEALFGDASSGSAAEADADATDDALQDELEQLFRK